MAMPESWALRGSYFETCSCETTCGCSSSDASARGDCAVLLIWHVEEGHFGDVSLSGLNTIVAVYSPCNKAEITRKVALYLDERASGQQERALAAIFSGQAGGHFAQVTQHIGEILGIRSASIEYRADGKRCSLMVGNVKKLATPVIDESTDQAIAGSHPAETVSGELAETASSEERPYEQRRYRLDISKENGFCAPFRYSNA
jgi:hypothetical protein